MDISQTKTLAKHITKQWGTQIDPFFKAVCDSLDAHSFLAPSSDTFEFSVTSKTQDLRCLHLRFFPDPLSLEQQKILCKKRFFEIYKIAHALKTHTAAKNHFQLNCIEDMYKATVKTNWPMQFGYVLDSTGSLRLKIYISVINTAYPADDSLQFLCSSLSLNWKKIRSSIPITSYDAIGIDLNTDGSYRLKIYPYLSSPFDYTLCKKILGHSDKTSPNLNEDFLAWTQNLPAKHIGFLYRVKPDSSLSSVKVWVRLKHPMNVSDTDPCFYIKSGLGAWWEEMCRLITHCNAKISYLTLEDDVPGIYFR